MSHVIDPCFVYEPAYMTCDLTYYSDTTYLQINGLLVAKVQYDPRLYKMANGISTSDLSTYFLPDLLSLLSMRESTYKETVKNHKSLTHSFNFIDYEELKQIYEYVDSLFKMSGRLKVIGCAATSILYDQRKLNTGVCIEGQIIEPDNLFVPTFHLFDNKIHDVQFICDFLLTGSRNRHYFSHQDTCLRKYAISGSIIYLIIYKRKSLYDYIIYVSEEPIQSLIQTIIENIEFATDFDFIHTVIGRTNTREESTPYTITQSGFYFKSIILYCNENSFTKPILLTYRTLLDGIKRNDDDDSQDINPSDSSSLYYNEQHLEKEFQSEDTSTENLPEEYPNIPFLSSCLSFYSSLDFQEKCITVIDQLFYYMIQHKDNISDAYEQISEILTVHKDLIDSIVDCSSLLDKINNNQLNPIEEAYNIAAKFLDHFYLNINIDKVQSFLNWWFDITQDENIENLKREISAKFKISNSSLDDYDFNNDEDDEL